MKHANQHYVPAFLLRQWQTPPDSKLTVMRWANGQLLHSRLKAKSVGKELHLYSMQRDQLSPNPMLEHQFMTPFVDEPASVVHAKILRGGVTSLTAQDKVHWSNFLVSLLLRGPGMMRVMRAKGRAVLQAGMDSAPHEYQAVRGDAPERTLTEWVRANAPWLFEDLAVLTFPDLVMSKLLNSAFLGPKSAWATRDVSGSPRSLLLGDTPLVYRGTFQTSFVVALPLSPTRCFVAFNEPGTWANLASQSAPTLAKALNRDTVSQAQVNVFATDAAQAKFVEKNLRRPSASHSVD
jgi:hypothetical protein